jgi:hypothetical protein
LKTLKRVWVLFIAAAVLAGCHEGSSDGTVGAASPTSTGAQTSSAATLSWEAPTTDTNGAPLNNLAGYRIYYGVSEAELRQTVQVNSVGMQTYVVDGLSTGTWYFAIRAFTNTGVESALSDIVSLTIS